MRNAEIWHLPSFQTVQSFIIPQLELQRLLIQNFLRDKTLTRRLPASLPDYFMTPIKRGSYAFESNTTN